MAVFTGTTFVSCERLFWITNLSGGDCTPALIEEIA
jgi:hypothetical protein